MADLETARAAKLALTTQLAGDDRVSGIGITGSNGDYGVKVNLVDDHDVPALPEEIDGVSVKTVVSGRVRTLS
jgi:hypothetical protein